jgi:hypothetical protein
VVRGAQTRRTRTASVDALIRIVGVFDDQPNPHTKTVGPADGFSAVRGEK